MNDFIRSFSEVTANDVGFVGGKGANLGEMVGAGFPVPPGFCITAEAFRRFMGKIDICEVPTDLANIARKFREISEKILSEEIPGDLATTILNAYQSIIGCGRLVAVRSSATAEDLPEASFAGQQDSYLNVDEESLLEYVKKCWASLWTERAIHYRINKGFDHSKVYLAVVVQQMVESEASGVAFSVNPLNSNHEEVIIESVWGLGEGLVSGQITPDRYVIEKNSGKILQREIETKKNMVVRPQSGLGTVLVPILENKRSTPSLSDGQVKELAEIVCRIEEYYGSPQDIEWALAENSFYVLQSRPVTTLNLLNAISTAADEPEFFSFDPNTEWTNVGLKERCHQPLSILGWSIIEPCQNAGLSWLYEAVAGKKIPTGTKLFNNVYGYLYMNFTLIKKISPTSSLANFLSEDKTGEFSPKRGNLQELKLLIKSFFAGRKMAGFLDKEFYRMLPGYLQEIKGLGEYELDSLSNRELYEYLLAGRTLAESFFRYQTASLSVAEVYYKVLTGFMVKWLDDKNMSLSAKLVSGLPNNLTVESNNDVWKLARLLNQSPRLRSLFLSMSAEEFLSRAGKTGEGRFFISQLEDLLKKHGHLNTRMDIATDFWWENPVIVLSMVRGFLSDTENADPDVREWEKKKVREETEAFVRSKLSFVQRLLLNWILPLTQTYMLLRDNRHYYVTMPFSLMKKTINRLGRRLQTEGFLLSDKDIFFLTTGEIEAVILGNMGIEDSRTLIMKRKSVKEVDIQELPSLFKGWPQLESSSISIEIEGKTLPGVGGSPGKASGPVKIIRSPGDFALFKAGEVLVTASTDPAWTPLFAIAKAVVTDYGGLLSHGAIVAREYGIPAVLGVNKATEILQDGQSITVDGYNGVVVIDS